VLVLGQQQQRLGVGVVDRADRLGHAGGFGGGQRVGDGLLQVAVDVLEIGGHQVLGERLVGRLAVLDELHAHLDEQGARGEHPEGVGGAAVGRDKRGRGGGEFALGLAVVEHRPGRAACVERVEDGVAVGIVEGFHISAGQVEDDGGVVALAHLLQKRAQRGGLARAGRADEHGVGLFEPVGVGDAGDG
jgi:hypothetical protein